MYGICLNIGPISVWCPGPLIKLGGIVLGLVIVSRRLITGWTVRGSNPGGGEIFRLSRPALGPTQPPVQWVPGLAQG